MGALLLAKTGLLHDIGSAILGVVVGLFLLAAFAALLMLLTRQLVPDRWACRRDWHRLRAFKLHEHGIVNRTETYLAIRNMKIEQCKACGVFDPP